MLYESNEMFADMWKQARIDAGKSQEYVAKKLCVSKKTVQNWEAGYSSPSIILGLEFFNVLGLPIMPYFLKILYPLEFNDLSSSSQDKQIEEALIRYIKGMRPEDKRKLLFVAYGDHGSSFSELIEMLTAHFHTPDENRITIAQNICTNFEIAQAKDRLIAKDHVMPDIKILKNAIIRKRNILLGRNDVLKE